MNWWYISTSLLINNIIIFLHILISFIHFGRKNIFIIHLRNYQIKTFSWVFLCFDPKLRNLIRPLNWDSLSTSVGPDRMICWRPTNFLSYTGFQMFNLCPFQGFSMNLKDAFIHSIQCSNCSCRNHCECMWEKL